MDVDFQYRRNFRDERKDIIEYVLNASSIDEGELSNFESLVSIKDSRRRITIDNKPFRDFMTGGPSTIENPLRLSPRFARLSETTDGLILDGVNFLEFEHIGIEHSGRSCLLQTYKRRLVEELSDPQYAILLVARPISYVGTSNEEHRQNLAELLSLMQKLDAIDELICHGYLMGDTTKEIAKRVGLTTRSVENRRQKVMDIFGFERPIQIVKMLVRLEENGLYKISS